MRVLVACEYSGRVREAFRKLGHDAWSCDLLPSEDNSPHHYTEDVLEVIRRERWDLMIAHPPCDYLTVAGNAWFSDSVVAKPDILTGKVRRDARDLAVTFVKQLWNSPIPKIVIENPIGRLSTLWMKPTQIIQPWQFGHPEFKATCLWLKGLPSLIPTDILDKPDKGTGEYKAWEKVHRMGPRPNRWKDRSRTYQGIANAMANQWGIE